MRRDVSRNKMYPGEILADCNYSCAAHQATARGPKLTAPERFPRINTPPATPAVPFAFCDTMPLSFMTFPNVGS
jgi:hypothetical protein